MVDPILMLQTAASLVRLGEVCGLIQTKAKRVADEMNQKLDGLVTAEWHAGFGQLESASKTNSPQLQRELVNEGRRH